MRKALFLIISLTFWIPTYAQESVVWGSEVIDISSEFSPLEYSALQALHKPNVLPQSGDNPNAWRPKREDSEEEFIMVSFSNPIRAKQVAIAESENPGAVTKVFAYDTDYNEYLLFELTPRSLPIEKRLLNLFFQETDYEIQAIKVFLNPSVSPGYNAIDAIGISTSNIPISVLIQLAAGVATEMDAENLGENVNSEYVEHSPIISPDGRKLYFSRKYHPENTGGVDDPEDIWVSEMDPETGEWMPAKNLGEPLNTAGPNFISSISQMGNEQVFVLGNRYGKKGRMYEGISISKLLPDGSFTAPEAVEIENEYNYSPKADFFLATGGQAMILSVERDDSYGGRDLYVSFKKGNTWSEPVNMGGTLNTLSDEAAPFLSEDGKTLYFSSAGYSGYGGMDIYVTRRLDDTYTRWSPPDNLGSGINTEKDDQYFSIPTTGKHLYFTRGDVDDDTDIFRFEVQEFFVDPSAPIASSVRHLLDGIEEEELIAAREKQQPEEDVLIMISGKVINPETNEPVPNVDVVVERLPDGVDIGVIKTNDEGYYEFNVKKGARYGVTPQLEGYLGESKNFDFNEQEESDSLVVDLTLKPIEEDKPIVINNIFFAFDKDELTTASYPELERILAYLKDDRINKIEIAGHTDSTGPEVYNVDLSRRRARSVYNFFLENGIDSSRLSAKGYGETQPVATNDTREGRRQNRRVEFKIIEK